MTIRILPEHAVRRVTLDGYAVPRVTVQEITASGQWNVIYDGRFCALAEDLEELNRWLPLIANVQAVAQGYSCHGENSVYRPNPHRVKIMFIDSASRDTQED
jgi:hypothetical protein